MILPHQRTADMGRDQADEADGAGEADGSGGQKCYKDEPAPPERLDVETKACGIRIAEAKRGQVPGIAQDQRQRQKQDRGDDLNAGPACLQKAAEQPEDDLLQHLRRGHELKQGLKRLKEEQDRDTGQNQCLGRRAAEPGDGIDHGAGREGREERRKRDLHPDRDRQRRAEKDRQRRPEPGGGRKAQRVRACQRVGEDRLHHQPAQPKAPPDQRPGQGLWHTDRPEDRGDGPVGAARPGGKAPDHLGQRHARGAGDQIAHHQKHKEGGGAKHRRRPPDPRHVGPRRGPGHQHHSYFTTKMPAASIGSQSW